MVVADTADELTVGFIGQFVLTCASRRSSIEIADGERSFTDFSLFHFTVILIDHVVHALEVNVLSLGGGIAVSQAFEGSELGSSS